MKTVLRTEYCSFLEPPSESSPLCAAGTLPSLPPPSSLCQSQNLPLLEMESVHGIMDLQEAQSWLVDVLNDMSVQFQKLPGSAIFLRYVKSSYQDDPVRSAVELFLFLFAVRYLLAPKYSTQKKSYITLSEDVRVLFPPLPVRD